MLDLNFITPKEIDGGTKLTVHKSGKLGFSKNAMELLDIENNKFCKFATNNADVNDTSIYMIVSDVNDNLSFKASKAGEYYYIKARSFLNDLEIDYSDESKTIIFDIQPIDYEGKKIYKLKKRIVERRN